MEENTKKRVRRTPQQIAEGIDAKIEEKRQAIADIEEKRNEAMAKFDERVATIEGEIKKLEEKKESILAPKAPRQPRKTKKQKIQDIVKAASKAGMKPEEIAERLGLQAEE